MGYLKGVWLFMHIMVVYWFSSWCRYFGHSNVGLYCMVLGGMVAIMCISAWVMGRGFSLWLITMMVVVFLGYHASLMNGCHGTFEVWGVG